MTTLPADPRNRGEKPPRYALSVDKNPYDRVGDPEHPSVVKVDGEWFVQVCNADEYPEGYMCRRGASWVEALGKVPELMEALRRRKQELAEGDLGVLTVQTLTRPHEFQVVDLTEVKLMVVVDLNNRAMIYGSQKGMSAFLLRHVADSLEARLAGEQE